MNTKERTLVMISIQGKGVSSGVGVGPLYFYHRTKTEESYPRPPAIP